VNSTLSLPCGGSCTVLVSLFLPSISKSTKSFPSEFPQFLTSADTETRLLGQASAGSIIRRDSLMSCSAKDDSMGESAGLDVGEVDGEIEPSGDDVSPGVGATGDDGAGENVDGGDLEGK
jgi:hypothetical protein